MFAKPIHDAKAYVAYPFGYSPQYFNNNRFHSGVDYNGIPGGTAIYPAAPGKVMETKYNISCEGCEDFGYGNFVSIDHGDGLMTFYAHLQQSEAYVSPGDYVHPGKQIGRMGTTGNSTGNHLHFTVRVNGTAVGPTLYLGKQEDNLSDAQFDSFCGERSATGGDANNRGEERLRMI